MRAFIVTAAAVALAAGCGGTGFTAGWTERINLHLGPVPPSCSAAGASTQVPFADGSTGSFVYQPVSPSACQMQAQWTGPLIDMAQLRTRIAKDEPDDFKDLNGLTIEHLDIDVSHINLRDTANDTVLNVPDTAVLQYQARVGLDANTPIVRLAFTNDQLDPNSSQSNPSHPSKTISNETAIKNELNRVLVSGPSPTGVGAITLQVNNDQLNDFVDATDPVLSFDLDYDVSGGAHQ